VKRALQIVIVIAASGMATLLAVELILPLVVRVTDRIEYVAVPGVGLGLRPNQEGRFIREGVDARFHVNGSGFNNPVEYQTARTPGVARVAVVGDSFVEAFHVNPGETFYAVLDRGLEARGVRTEMYSFGISGFGTSQVFRLVDDTVLRYAPDVVVYLFIRNDVSDSSACLDRADWTQQYDLTQDGRLEALPVATYSEAWWKDLLQRSRLFRYFFYQRRLLERVRAWGHPAGGPIAPGSGACVDRSWRIVEALLVEMRRRLAERGVPFLVVWQGDADPGYAADVRGGLEEIARRQHLELVDPSPAFVSAAAGREQPFRIPGDGHWNADGHRVVGTMLEPIVERLLQERGREGT
jgi:hypothetical protein